MPACGQHYHFLATTRLLETISSPFFLYMLGRRRKETGGKAATAKNEVGERTTTFTVNNITYNNIQSYLGAHLFLDSGQGGLGWMHGCMDAWGNTLGYFLPCFFF